MISSKPPCEIVIDGKSTGLTTPQRAISLSGRRAQGHARQQRREHQQDR